MPPQLIMAGDGRYVSCHLNVTLTSVNVRSGRPGDARGVMARRTASGLYNPLAPVSEAEKWESDRSKPAGPVTLSD
jgi:hypothetical protein